MNFEENLEDFDDLDSGQNRDATLIQRVYARTANFLSILNSLRNEINEGASDTLDSPKKISHDAIENAVRKYIDFQYTFDEKGTVTGSKNALQIDLNKNCFEAINCQQVPDLNMESSRAIILIEFFTHCCINCVHSIEDIRQVYEELQNTSLKQDDHCFGIKVVSVHSPKFTREKDKNSIKAFVNRNSMNYSDVINDPGCLLWNELGISCWPTVLIFGSNPFGTGMNLLFNLMGEGHKEALQLILKYSLKYYEEKTEFKNSKSIDSTTKPVAEQNFEAKKTSSGFLKFPGKVTYFQRMLAISDSGNNRIIISSPDGSVQHIIGGFESGFKDGNFENARFYSPQGIAFQNDKVFYVADTGNHSIRKIDLKNRSVSTLVSSNWTAVIMEETVALKSPWDLAFYNENVLLVAAAGNHRIFAYFFAKTKLFNTEYAENTLSVIAGSGKEENRNNSYILKASFAQPSGICVAKGLNENENTIYIADSESSSIRSITSTGKVVAVVGGARDPTDLFSFGDADGKGVNVKLQHPMGVCWNSLDSKIYIADTYNNKIKVVDVVSKECLTIFGDTTGNENNDVTNSLDIKKLNEPSGISIDNENEVLYIADTNNHSVKRFNIKQKSVFEILLKTSTKNLDFSKTTVNKAFEVNSNAKTIDLKLLITNIPSNFEGGQWTAFPVDQIQSKISGEVKRGDDGIGSLNLTCECSLKSYRLSVDIFLCGSSSCYKKSLKFLINITPTENEINSACLKYEPDLDFFSLTE